MDFKEPIDSYPRPQGDRGSGGGEGEFHLAEYFEIFSRRRNGIVLVFLAIVILGSLYTLTRKKIYEASAKLVVVTRNPGTGGGGTAEGGDILANLGGLTQGRNVGTQVEIIDSDELLDQAFKTLTPAERKLGFRSEADSSIPLWAYRIESKPDTDVITVTVSSYVPALAAKLANGIANTYLARDLEQNNQATRQAREYVAGELDRSRASLRAAANKVAAFKQRSHIVDPDSELDQATQRIFSLRSATEAAHGQLDGADNSLNVIAGQLRRIKPQVLSSTTVLQNPVFAQSSARLNDLQSQKFQLLQEYNTDSQAVKAIDQQIRDEQAALKNTAKTIVGESQETNNPVYDSLLTSYASGLADRAVADSQYREASAALASAQKEIQQYPKEERDLSELLREEDVLKHTYEMLSERYYGLLINEKSNLPNGVIASAARPAILPTSPKVIPSLVMVLLLGVLLAFGTALVQEKFDVRVHDPLVVERITGVSILAAVPDTPGLSKERPLIGSPGVSLNHGFLESYRILRNNVVFSAPGRKLKILGVTSPVQGEGKSTTAVNLAISMAMDGRRVLLIDGDLRRPAVHVTLDLGREVGFTSVVAGLSTLENAVQKTHIENLFCLTSGPLPPNPTEFLNSEPSRDLMKQATELYDLVIVDSPPCVGLSDVQVISSIVEGLILVVAIDRTLKPPLRTTIRTLHQVYAPLIGIVVNRININRGGYYYSYYYAYEEDAPKKSSGKEKILR